MTSGLATLNVHLAKAQPSSTYQMMDRVAARRASGAAVISLSAGEPDFDTPKHICEAAIDAIRAGHTRYTPVSGIRSLREAVAEKFRTENNLDVQWQDTMVCSGGKHVIYNALAATLNEGDEVIVPAPYWVSYPEMVQMVGARPVIVSCGSESDFKLTPEVLRRAITARTRWLILNSPSNPTGAVYTREDLAALAEVLLEHPDILVLSDDIYEHLIFDGATFHTIASVEPRLQPRTLTMNGVSKAYAMTGWRIGFGTGPRWLLMPWKNSRDNKRPRRVRFLNMRHWQRLRVRKILLNGPGGIRAPPEHDGRSAEYCTGAQLSETRRRVLRLCVM